MTTATSPSPPPTAPVTEPVALVVLVPVLDEEKVIRDTAEAMRAQTLTDPVRFVFLDGGSSDATREILEELAREDERLLVLDNPDRFIPHALNRGLAATESEFVARMDAHTSYPPEYLANGLERLRRGGVDQVSGPALAMGANRGSELVARALSSRLGVGGGASFRRARSEEEWEVESGASPACGGAETTRTARRLGRRLAGQPGRRAVSSNPAPEAGASCRADMAGAYIPRDTIPRLASQYWRYGQYRVKTSVRHPHSMRISHIVPPALLVALAASVLAPRRPRMEARTLSGAYLASVALESRRLARHGDPREAAQLAVVFATLHLTWGAGFCVGCRRYGIPARAMARVLARRGRPSRRARGGTNGRRATPAPPGA